MSEAIRVEGLVKSFGPARALDGLQLSVLAGEAHGLLGAAGAGKTTAFRVLLGLVQADSGIARLLDGDCWRDGVRLHRRLAYAPTAVRFWPNLSGGEIIDFLCRLRGGQLDGRRRDDLIDRLSLNPHRKARKYSAGERQKLAVISALASDAELLLLDQPTSEMDPTARAVVRVGLLEAKQRGQTILLSGESLDELADVCDRISVIRSGRTIESGSPHSAMGDALVSRDRVVEDRKVAT
ncbi:ABC transporter ATP-binding protein [Micromonospora arborensis]|uniref:ABC transporter ATP-binding protein n=1 Tax=Micromonospora arborensis TaxID=2116518 RepID=UPI0033FA6030